MQPIGWQRDYNPKLQSFPISINNLPSEHDYIIHTVSLNSISNNINSNDRVFKISLDVEVIELLQDNQDDDIDLHLEQLQLAGVIRLVEENEKLTYKLRNPTII